MLKVRTLFFCGLLLAVLHAPLLAQESLHLAAGAGYKRLVQEICTAFTAQSGIKVQLVFGNMGQIVPQVREGGDFDFILGDKSHLEAANLAFAGEHVLGKGRLVAAVAKGSSLMGLNGLTDPAVSRIAIADAKKAIYGRAAAEYFANSGLEEKIQDKVLVVGTVPQVSAYVISGEVDVGFINLTEALAIEGKIARLLPVDEQLYSPVLIVAYRLQQSPHGKAAEAFISFLESGEARAIIQGHGL